MTTLEHVPVEPLSNVYRSPLDGEDKVLEKCAVTTGEGVAIAAEEEVGQGEDGAPGRSQETLRSSHSRSRSSSRSVLSVRVGMSSSATSWTQVEGRASAECRSSADERGGEVEGAREEGTEVGAEPRLGTGVDVGGRNEEVLVMQEEDIGDGWHPLRLDDQAAPQDEEKVEEEDVGAESVRGDDRTMEINEKEQWRTFGSSGRNARHLRLEFKAGSPQSWDDIDPPAENNETYASDYYSTLNSKKFETLQKSRRRPLIPHSTYYFGPPPPGSAYGTSPVGQIGVHHPREIVRIERDYTGGELTQFSPVFPLELEGRITPTQFHQTINDINEILISAHSIQYACLENCLAVITLQLSTLFTTSHYTKEMRRLKRKIEEQNTQLYNPVGLNILWPRKVAFLFLEIEYY